MQEVSLESYRQAGIRVAGKVIRGPINCSTKVRLATTATIPSKFETILHPQNVHQQKAFGSTSGRFDAQKIVIRCIDFILSTTGRYAWTGSLPQRNRI